MAKIFDTNMVTGVEKNLLSVPLTGADFLIIFDGYESLVFSTKTSKTLTPKNEAVEYTGLYGIKFKRSGKVQTQNTLQLSIMAREDNVDEDTLNSLIANGVDNLSGTVYSGTNLTQMKIHSMFEHGFLLREEGADLDTESGTTPLDIQYTLECHFKEKPNNIIVDVAQIIANA